MTPEEKQQRQREASARYRAKNKEKIATSWSAYYAQNKVTINDRTNRNYALHGRDKELKAKTDREYREANREELSRKRKERWAANAREIGENRRLWYRLRRELNMEYQREYRRRRPDVANRCRAKRLRENVGFRIACNLRGRLAQAIKHEFRVGSAVADLGCTIQEFKTHIEKQFQPGMSWDNWGRDTWHLDHIKPLASFDLKNREKFLQATHFTNMQPLWAADNLKKGAKLAA